jgi:hypothetical protein
MISRRKLKELVDKYDALPLECDGLTRVLAHVLTRENIDHKVFVGSFEFQGRSVPIHFWIEIGKYRIDYRLRMWLGQIAPHGVVEIENCPVAYFGKEVEMDVPEIVFQILGGGSVERRSEEK